MEFSFEMETMEVHLLDVRSAFGVSGSTASVEMVDAAPVDLPPLRLAEHGVAAGVSAESLDGSVCLQARGAKVSWSSVGKTTGSLGPTLDPIGPDLGPIGPDLDPIGPIWAQLGPNIILFHIILYYFILFYIILYYSILFHIILHIRDSKLYINTYIGPL